MLSAATKKTASERKLELFCSLVFIYYVIIIVYFFSTFPQPYLQFSNAKVNVELALTPGQKIRGLGGRNYLSSGKGMLLAYDQPAQHYIWMKDMQFPIDIVWMDSGKKVIKVHRNISPATYPATFTAGPSTQYILELPASQAAKLNITEGQSAQFLMR